MATEAVVPYGIGDKDLVVEINGKTPFTATYNDEVLNIIDDGKRVIIQYGTPTDFTTIVSGLSGYDSVPFGRKNAIIKHERPSNHGCLGLIAQLLGK